jgi:hypothetical protein
MSFTDPKPYCPLSGISCYALELGTATDVMARDPTDKIEEARFRFVYYHTESEDDFKTAKYCYDKARQARFEHGEKP